MDQKLDFVTLALKDNSNFSQLCKRFNISRKTGYKWVERFKNNGINGLHELSRKPTISPIQTPSIVEEHIISIRKENPEWGAKKIHRILLNGLRNGDYHFDILPAVSTINKVLKRNNLVNNRKRSQSKTWKRFEYEAPNQLWQMDFKGYFHLLNNQRCYPLTITDDYSRFNISLTACENEQYKTVYNQLERVFQMYGLPEIILADNGNPWGTSGVRGVDGQRYYTKLEKWLMQLQVKVIHGRVCHPQTQGKEERFHRTLKTELLNYESFRDQDQCQERFNKWRYKYNYERPHEALGQDTPSSRYCSSTRSYPSKLPEIEYDLGEEVRNVNVKGYISRKGNKYFIGEAFEGEKVAIRPTLKEGIKEVYFCNTLIKKITL